MTKPKTVVLGLLGTRLDAATGHDRWGVWRPSVSVIQQSDWPVDRFELLYEARWAEMAERVMADMRGASPHTEVRGHEVNIGENPWDFESVFDGLFAFARSYAFDPDTEDYYVHITTGTHVAQICLFLLTESRHLPAKLLQTAPKQKAHSKLRAEGRVDIIDLDLARYDRLQTRFAEEQRETRQHLKSGIATKNKAFNSLIERIERVAAASRDPMLLTGPTGAGKGQLARRIYELRQRAGLRGKFVEVNCATLRGDAAMSTLFGHVKGAFTGAVAAFPGMLSEAHGGTLFLDEITELPVELQTRFLRVLQEREFRPLGSVKNLPANFRLIAACNRPPALAVQEGRLRQDLYFRLKTFEIEVPPLRERREDLPKLTGTFLRRFAQQLGRPVPQLAPETLELLRQYPWPGNVRELQNAIEHGLVLCDGPILGPQFLPREIQRPDLVPAPAVDGSAPLTLGGMEREALLGALRRSGGNKKRAAEVLGIHRASLYAKLKRFGISL